MKYGQWLDDHAVPEWRSAYLNYKGLKKVIKRTKAHHRRRLELLAQEYGAQDAPPTSSSSSFKSKSSPESLTSLRSRVRSAQQGTGSYGSTSRSADLAAYPRPPREAAVDPITLEGTGLRLTPSILAKLRESGEKSRHHSSVMRESVQNHGIHTDVEQATSGPAYTAVRAPPPPTTAQSSGTGHSHSKKKQQHRRKSTALSNGGGGGSGEDLESYLSTLFPAPERLFFLCLDSELQRITDFYEKELSDAQTRFLALAQQLSELAEHRKLYKEAADAQAEQFDWRGVLTLKRREKEQNREQKRGGGAHSHHPPPSNRRQGSSQETAIDPSVSPSDVEPTSTDVDSDQGTKRRSLVLERMQQLAAAEERDSQRGAAITGQTHDPERYKAARHKLKDAIAEFHRGLELLRTYANVLNKTGMGKILKKFDKALEVETAQKYWQERVEPSVLVKSQRIDDLLRSTEDAFAGFFEHGDRKRALDRLRSQGQVASALRTHHGAAGRTGLFLGIALCAIVGGLVEAMKPETQERIPAYEALLRVYGALFIPVLFALLWGVNLAVFAHARVSTIFIFEWNPRTALDYHQYPELPAFLLLLLSVAFWVSFVNPFPESIAPTTWPLVWIVVMLVLLSLPVPVFHLHSRLWFIRAIARVFTAGALPVVFADFILGDLLNSIAWPISTLWFIGCEYQRDWHSPQCSPNDTYWTAFLSSLPALLRLGQCLRRWSDSRLAARVHLLNATKYSTTVYFYFFYIHWRKAGSERDGSFALWVVFACLYSATTCFWDLFLDWGLLHVRAKYPLLRNELLYEDHWPLYYWALLSNIVLRCSWIIYFLPGPASLLTRTFLIALLEMLRRWQWAFLRIANEHSQNVSDFRALRDTPLPYTVPKGSDDDGEEGERKGSASAALRMRTWRRKIKGKPEAPAVVKRPQLTTEGMSGDGRTSNLSAAIASTTSSAAAIGISRPPSMLDRFQAFLVPDRGGWAAKGHRLDEEAIVTGSMGRDYAPRPQEADADSDDESDADGDGDGETGTDRETDDGDEGSGSGNGGGARGGRGRPTTSGEVGREERRRGGGAGGRPKTANI